MDWDLEQLKTQALEELRAAADKSRCEAVRIKYLGKNGLITQMFRQIGSLPPEERPRLGQIANTFRDWFKEQLRSRLDEINSRTSVDEGTPFDPSLPGLGPGLGRPHILSQLIEEICSIFRRMGFCVMLGPEIEDEFHNFSALNIPADHPSRDAFDTFYLKTDGAQQRLLLRSHTSPAQIRVMQRFKPPLAVVIPGKVYRPDATDASHASMFHQIEGLLVDERVSFAQLKGLLHGFCRRFFGAGVRMRFRPHFFPFTEPSAEVDIDASVLFGKNSRKQWLEIMGCGLVHPHVLEAAGYPPGRYQGLAFGMGVERMAMLRYGIPDIRLFVENDQRFLNQF